MKKEKIVIHSNSLKGGGTERFIYYLLEYLQEDYEIHLLLTESKIEYPIPQDQIISYLNKDHHKIRNSTSLWEFPKFLGKIPLYGWRLKKYCRENEISFVLSFLPRANYPACFMKLIGFDGKVLISERVHTPSFYSSDTIKGKIGKFMVSALYPRADVILPNSHGNKHALGKDWGIKSKYEVVKNIIDVKKVKEMSKESVNDVSFDKFTFVNLAGFREQKNHKFLLESFAKFDNSDCQLLLLGKGKTMEENRKLAKDLGIEDSVIFYGFTENPYKYLSKSDCFILSSDFEGFPNVLLESMACETPIISTDCPTGPRELLSPKTDYTQLLKDGLELTDNGMLVSVNDSKALSEAMKKAFEEKELLENFKKNASERVLGYDIENVIGEIREILKRSS